MPLLYSAFVPHSPLLIPSIGKENRKILNKTLESYKTIEEKLKAHEIETVILISPHVETEAENFLINTAKEFNIKFNAFGDLASKRNLKGDTVLGHHIKEELKEEKINLITEEQLDYGSGVPLFLLSQEANFKTLVVSPHKESLERNYHFGEKLNKIIEAQNKNIAVIASGDLSHCLTKNSPGGYSPKAKKFDNKIIEIVSSSPSENILTLDENLIKKAGECGLKSLTLLLGLLSQEKAKPQQLSYQDDFGVGYLTTEFNLDY